MNNPNCAYCGHMNYRGFCNLTACMYPIYNNPSRYYIIDNKSKTNYDIIKNLSVQELANYLSYVAKEGMNGKVCSKGVWTKAEIAEGKIIPWLKWLQQEVNDE